MANLDFSHLLSSDTDDYDIFGGGLIKDKNPFFGVPDPAAPSDSVTHDIGDPDVETGDGGWSNDQHVDASSVPLPRGYVSVAIPRLGSSISPNEFDQEASTADILYNCFGNSGEERQLTGLAPLQGGVPSYDERDSEDEQNEDNGHLSSLITNNDDKSRTEECVNGDGDTAEVACPHGPPNLQHKRFKGARCLQIHCGFKHPDLEFKSTVIHDQSDCDGDNFQQSLVPTVSGERVVEVEGEQTESTAGSSLQTRNGKRRQSITGNSSQAGPPPKRSRRREKKPKKGDRNLDDYNEDDPEYKKTRDAIKSKQNREKNKDKMKRLEDDNSRLMNDNQTLRQENLDLREELKSERMSNQSSNVGIRVINNIDPTSGMSVCVTLDSEQLPGAAGNEQTVTVALKVGITSPAK